MSVTVKFKFTALDGEKQKTTAAQTPIRGLELHLKSPQHFTTLDLAEMQQGHFWSLIKK